MKLIIYKDKRKEFRWKLKARNGRILAASGEGYKRKFALMNIIQKAFFGIPITDLTK